ncbi:MAG: 50S ribosomal protein L24 [Candidatus Thermoplasmatota archaeon]|nr:50S ribosomal protein L24 [Candidatus Thermoplasmatota archaeon]MBS3801190.1 50S ribosomal protein L24 [Candidatus Thermoplasmatota archaeon]
MKSSKARKQRKAFFNAPLHQRRKQVAAHLDENLLLKYDKRRIPVVKGDTVKIMRGAFKGQENKISKILLKKHLVEIEGITVTKADGKQIARSVHPSNLLVTKLNLTDKWRRQRLEEGLSSETRKEIEEEATDQMKQLEEERKAEEQRQKEEEEAAQREEEEPETVEEKKSEESAESEKPAKQEKEVVEEKKQKETPSQKKSKSEKESEESKNVAKSTPSKTKETDKKSKVIEEEKSEEKKEEKQ